MRSMISAPALATRARSPEACSPGRRSCASATARRSTSPPAPWSAVRRPDRSTCTKCGRPTAASASGSDHIQRAATTRYRSPLPALTGWQGRPHGWPGSTKTVPGITRTTDTAARRARNWLRVASRSRGSGRLQGMTGTQQFEAIVSAHGRDSILDVAYRIVDSPVGPLLLAATEQGLVRVAYARQDHGAVLQALANKVSPRILHAPARLDLSARELEEYFAGRRHAFDLPLDWRLSAGFGRTVLSHLPEIGYGHTASYATIAQLAGNPQAVRAVGSACATNPMPVVVPCHRVVRSDGSVGGYLGGADAKRTLLTLEAAA